MQTNWIVIILSVLVTMGLLMVVQSQYQLKSILDTKMEMTEMALDEFSDEYLSKDLFKTSVEALLFQGNKEVTDLRAALNKVSSEKLQKNMESDECQEKTKTTKEELENIQRTQSETKASLEAEVEAWTQEINTLKETLTRHSAVCAYVKKSPLADKFCGINIDKDTTSANKTNETKVNK